MQDTTNNNTEIDIEDNETNEILRDIYISVILGLYELKDYDIIRQFIKKYNIPIDIKDSNNENSLVYMAGENLDYECIEFCIENGCAIEELNYATRKAMGNYNDLKMEETCKFIDNLIQRGADPWDVMHYSLVWSNYLELHKYMRSKSYDNKNFYIDNTFEMCGRFGNFESIKYILEDEEYSKCLSEENIKSCLKELIYVDTHCTGTRYKAIEYLIKNKNIALDDTTMQKINTFLNMYSAETLDKRDYDIYPWTKNENEENFQSEIQQKRNKWTKENNLYMSDLFK